jgi:hypothetical protein
MLEQNPHETKKLSAALNPEEFRGALDVILAGRRESAAELRDDPWWVPSAPRSEVIGVASDWDTQSEGRLPHASGWHAPSD